MSLFLDSEPIRIATSPDGEALLYPEMARDFIGQTLDQLIDLPYWETPEVFVFGKKHLVPRQTFFMGKEGLKYHYSGLTHTGRGFEPPFDEMILKANQFFERDWNCFLANHYRDGQDRMGAHSDDEPELGETPWILSLTLGESRTMRFKNKKGQEKIDLEINDGDALLMTGDFQSYWTHEIPKRARVKGPRINFTLREIII